VGRYRRFALATRSQKSARGLESILRTSCAWRRVSKIHSFSSICDSSYALSKASADRRLLYGILTGRGATVPWIHRLTCACTTGIVTASLDSAPSLSVTCVFTCGHIGQWQLHMHEQLGYTLPNSTKILDCHKQPELQCYYHWHCHLPMGHSCPGTANHRRTCNHLCSTPTLTCAVLLHWHCH